MTILVAAHNEVARIGDRIENLLALDYPRDSREILLASDGSTDGTAERARAWEQDGVSVVAFESRRGKPAVLNDLVQFGRVRRPSLGIAGLLPIGPELADEMGLAADAGVLVQQVVPGGAADRAG